MPQPKIDILMVAPTPFFEERGCHFRIREEAKALKKASLSSIIVAFGQGKNVKDIDVARSSLDFITFKKGPTASWKKIPALFFLFFTTLRLIIKYKPPVIYCHLLEGLIVGYLALAIVKISSFWSYKPLLIFDSQGDRAAEMESYGMMKNRTLVNIFRSIEQTMLRLPDHIFVSSLNYFNALQKNNSLKNKVSYLADGPSFSLSKTDNNDPDQKKIFLKKVRTFFYPEDYSLIKEWLKDERFIVIYTGSFNEAKGFPDFIKKVLPSFENQKDIGFIFGGEQQDYLKNQKSNSIFLKEIRSNQLKNILCLADLGIDPKPPKSTESSGKIINYMAAGLPVLALNNPNNRHFLNNEDVLLKDITDFPEKINYLAKNRDLVRRIGQENRKRLDENFSWDLQIRKILAIISQR